MQRAFIPFVLVSLLIATSCGKPRIDGSSEEALMASVSKVTESLSEADQKRFSEAVMALAMSGMTSADMRATLSGKTAKEVIALAEPRINAAKAKERADAVAEIKKLEEAETAVAVAKTQLAKFEISDAHLTKTPGLFPEPFIVLRAKNGTAYAVKHAYFRGKVTSPGRSVAWIEDDFDYDIAGGIEPREEATWRMRPGTFSKWSQDVPRDSKLEVTVVKLIGADGKRLFTELEFSENDAARLQSLRKLIAQ